jgi:hypothetical protein
MRLLLPARPFLRVDEVETGPEKEVRVSHGQRFTLARAIRDDLAALRHF